MKRKIIIDSSQPTDKEIEALKDWPEVNRGTSTRANWMVRGIAAAIIGGIISLFWWMNGDSHERNLGTITVLQNDTLLAEIPNYPLYSDLPQDKFEWDASESATFLTSNGAIIKIDANSFGTIKDKGANLTLTFTDLSDPWAIFSSGIPMDYDSAGVRHFFQSAGMFDIQVERNGQPLKLAPGKQLDIAYPTYNADDKMNTYLLKADNTWHYIEPSKTESLDKVCEKMGLVIKRPVDQPSFSTTPQNGSASVKLPVAPRKANPDNYRFNLDIDPVEFPQFSEMLDIQFEVIDPRFKYHFYNETWESIDLKALDNDEYLVILKKKKKEERFKVYPVLEGKAFETAFKAYEEKRAELAQESDKNKHDQVDYDKWTADQRAREPQIATVKKDRKFYNNITASLDEGKKYRTVSIPSLGICNFDNPIKLPVGKGLDAAFYFTENGHTIQFPEVCLIELSTPLFLQYTGSELREFRYRPRMTNCIVAYGPGGRIAVGMPSLFRDIPKEAKYWHFKLELSPEPINSFEELQAFVEQHSAEMSL
jgi:hypothetical protein